MDREKLMNRPAGQAGNDGFDSRAVRQFKEFRFLLVDLSGVRARLITGYSMVRFHERAPNYML